LSRRTASTVSGGLGETESLRDVAETIRGATNIHTLIFDEAASLPKKIYALAYATMRGLGGKEKRVFVVGTPPSYAEHWVAKMAERQDINLIQADARQNPFIEPDYLQGLEQEYEFLPDDFKRRELYGEFAFSGDGDLAVFRGFEFLEGAGHSEEGDPIVAGLDISGRGSDLTVMTIMRGSQILDIIVGNTPADEDIRRFARVQWERWQFAALRYDSTGFGHLLTFDLPEEVVVQPVNFGSSGGERFADAKALIYAKTAKRGSLWLPRELLKAHGDLIKSEMKAAVYKEGDNRKLRIIDKMLVKKKIGRSPDRLESLCLCCSYERPPPRQPPKIAPRIFNGRPTFAGQRIFGDR